MSKLANELRNLQQSDEYPFHMPGHKRNMQNSPFAGAYNVDITEIEGYDNLYEADGILKNALSRAKKIFESDKTWFLVNGSTVGILTAISAVTKYGDKILISRNSHKAVYHACELRGLQISYLYSQSAHDGQYPGVIEPGEVESALLKDSEIKAVVITSPTYEGLVSDIRQIASIAHEKGIPLIVDEAHGAHFSFHERFPESAIRLGADIVIQSLHKTLPSFTQTAVMHMKGDLVDQDKLTRFLGYYQTSSPSYLFMAGMDECIEEIEKKGSLLWSDFFEFRDCFLRKCKALKKLKVISNEKTADPCKIIISCKDAQITGRELQLTLLKKYHLQFEMATDTYILAIVTAKDTKQGFDRLFDALYEMDNQLDWKKTETNTQENVVSSIEQIINQKHPANVICNLQKASECEKKWLNLSMSEGQVAGEYVNLYPPGTPILVPGEEISKEIIELVEKYLSHGLHVQGIMNQKILVLDNQEY